MGKSRKASRPWQRRVLAEADRQGWTCRQTSDGWQLLDPHGYGIVTLHATASDWRTLRNTTGRLRRLGFDTTTLGKDTA